MVYSLNLKDDEVHAALEAKRASLETPPGSDIDFIRNETARFIEGNPGCRAVFKMDEAELKLWLELPVLSGRGLRAQDIVASVFGLKNASTRLTRERLVFRQDGDRTPPV